MKNHAAFVKRRYSFKLQILCFAKIYKGWIITMKTKRILIAFCVFLLAFPVLYAGFTNSAAVTFLIGDVNGDGAADAGDARLILRHVANLEKLKTPDGFPADKVFGDVDGSGTVDAADARLVLRYAAKLIDKFDIEDIVVETEIGGGSPGTTTTTAFRGYTTSPPTKETTTAANWMLPTDLRALLSGTYSYRGITYRYDKDSKLISEDKLEFAIKNNKDFYVSPIFDEEETEDVPFNDLGVLKKVTNKYANKEKVNIYLLNNKNSKYIDTSDTLIKLQLKILKLDIDDIVDFTPPDFQKDAVPDNVETVDYYKNELTCYTFENEDKSFVLIYMNGDIIKTIESYDKDSNIKAITDFENFSSGVGKLLDDPKSRDYKLVHTLTSLFDVSQSIFDQLLESFKQKQ